MFNFKFLKPYYPEEEIIELFNISKSTLQRYRAECMKQVSFQSLWEDLGYFHITGIKNAMYEPVRFSNWLISKKIDIGTNYSHDKKEKEDLSKGIQNLLNVNPSITKTKVRH